MIEQKLAVVGGGQMGRALVSGMLAAGVVKPDQVTLVEPSHACLEWWATHHPSVATAELQPAVTQSEVVLLAVKPGVISTVANQKGRFWSGKFVVSIAAGVGLAALSKWIGHQRVARVMPNTPSLVGQGASAFCCGGEVTDQDKVQVESLLSSVGLALEVDEGQMDAVTGLSGSGPAYVCMMIEALADGGVMTGLPRPMAMQLATQTVLGTAQMIAETGQHPGQLKDAVASPGGTTIAAISTLEQNGLRAALIEAVAASAKRSRELGGIK